MKLDQLLQLLDNFLPLATSRDSHDTIELAFWLTDDRPILLNLMDTPRPHASWTASYGPPEWMQPGSLSLSNTFVGLLHQMIDGRLTCKDTTSTSDFKSMLFYIFIESAARQVHTLSTINLILPLWFTGSWIFVACLNRNSWTRPWCSGFGGFLSAEFHSTDIQALKVFVDCICQRGMSDLPDVLTRAFLPELHRRRSRYY